MSARGFRLAVPAAGRISVVVTGTVVMTTLAGGGLAHIVLASLAMPLIVAGRKPRPAAYQAVLVQEGTTSTWISAHANT